MAQGDITERIGDMHVDFDRNRVTVNITRIIELPDGTLWSLDTRQESKTYSHPEDYTAVPIDSVKADVTVKAAPPIKVDNGLLGT